MKFLFHSKRIIKLLDFILNYWNLTKYLVNMLDAKLPLKAYIEKLQNDRDSDTEKFTSKLKETVLLYKKPLLIYVNINLTFFSF